MTEEKKPETQSAPLVEPPGQHLPAVFCNRFHITVSPDVTRIVFAETVPPSANVTDRGVLMMRTLDAKELAEVLIKLIQENEKAVQAAGQTS